MNISACMITKNEENNIERCINSYKDAVSEIIVVDTGSIDNTVQLARELGAKVFCIDWENDFAKAKNEALSKATGDWIIFLDADEYFSEETSKNLKNIVLKHDADKKLNGIMAKIVNIDIYDNDSVLSELRSMRIFRGHNNLTYKGNIHETPQIKNGQLNCAFEGDIVIYHTGYTNVINIGKLKRNLEILEYNNKNGEAGEFENEFYLAETYLGLNDYENALKHIKSALDDKKTILGYKVKPFKIYFDSMVNLSRFNDEFYDLLKTARKKFPKQSIFIYYEAVACKVQNRYTEALKYFKETLVYNKKYDDDFEIDPTNKLLDRIYYFMGNIYEMMNKRDEALDCYIESLKLNIYGDKAFERFAILSKCKKQEKTVAVLNSIYNLEHENHVRFLIEQLTKYKIGLVLYYYWKIWHERFGYEDSSFLMMLLANNKYQDAFNNLMQVNEDEKESHYYQMNIVVAALLSADMKCLEGAVSNVSKKYQRIILAFLGIDNTTLTDAEIEVFLGVLEQFISITNQETTGLLLSINADFSILNEIRICNLLSKWCFFDLAVDRYNMIFEKIYAVDDKIIILKDLGICLFEIGKLEESKSAFEKAVNLGYEGQDVLEFLEWISDTN